MTQSLLDTIEIGLGQERLYIDVRDSSLSRKWLAAVNQVLTQNLHLEKNYAWLGWASSPRNGDYILAQINQSIQAINASGIGYHIDDHFSWQNSVNSRGGVAHQHFNQLHRYFEDLQGQAGRMSPFWQAADATTRWHIRQLNLLCHEFESWQLSWRKLHTVPEWQRPSLLMCWLGATRFQLEPEDFELFGLETINRELGGVYVGVNKAVGKHHWEVFCDEGRDSRITELTTTSLATQTLACADFDIEWGRNPAGYEWQQQQLADFAHWLRANGFDPQDTQLTLGHPQVAQVDLERSFGTDNPEQIWQRLARCLDVREIKTSQAQAQYNYTWADPDYMEQQIKCLG